MVNSILSKSHTKVCAKCGEIKSTSEFNFDVSRKDGLHSQCKHCRAIISSAWREKNLEKDVSRKKAWSIANKDKEAARKTAWERANPEKVAKRNAIQNKNHYKKIKANPILYKIYTEKERIRAAARYKANPDAFKARNRIRRARKLNAGGSHTSAQIADLLLKQRCKCAYCKTSIKKRYHIDHITPLARGGSNQIGNIQLLCANCNLRKSSKDPIQFAQQRGMLL